MSTEKPPEVNPDSDAWWEYLYKSNTTPWELGDVAPPFQTFLRSPYAVPPGRMVIPGCVTGNEVLFFASQGFEVTGVDFTPSAVQATAQKLSNAGLLGTKGFLLQRDFFSIHEYDSYFDYCLEHTCFCAIHPSRRRTYAMTVRDLLKPGGKLIALWWLLNHKGGPPFASHKNEIFDLFSNYFHLDLSYTPQDSAPDRKGKELLTVMTRLP